MSDPLELLARAAVSETDEDRRYAWIGALVAGADPTAIAQLHTAASDPVVEIRMLAQLGLARLGDRDVALLEERVELEPDLGVFAVLVARAGALPISERVLTTIGAQAAYLGTAAEVRAGCCWTVAQHDIERGGWLAGTLLRDPETAFWLASITLQRGGPLVRLIDGIAARPELDRVGVLLAG